MDLPKPDTESDELQILLLGESTDDLGNPKFWGVIFFRGHLYAFWKRHGVEWMFQASFENSIQKRWKEKQTRYKKLTKRKIKSLFDEIDMALAMSTLTDGLYQRGQRFPTAAK